MGTYELKLTEIGEGIVEAEIVKWLVKTGDVVVEDQPLVEVMTDKATVEIPSHHAGKISKLHGVEGDVVKVHDTIVTLEIDGVSPPASPPVSAVEHPAPPVSSKASTEASRVLATPVTRRMAREHGIDLSQISATGPQRRIMKADVVAAIGHAPTQAEHAGDKRIPLRGLRKKIAEKMVKSKHSAPHFTFVEEMDATELVLLRQRLNDSLSLSGETAKVTFLPFILKGLVAALKKFPTLNANFDEVSQELIVRADYNIGIAVATPDGLTVPVIKAVDQRSIRELAEELMRLSRAAQDRKLSLGDITGGTFTVTSLGQKAGLLATPIINHPEVAILGVHKMRKTPVVDKDDQIVVRQMMALSLSFDHRVIDGDVGADFTYALIHILEHPEMLSWEG